MQKKFMATGILLVALAIVTAACGSATAPKLGVADADTFVFIYTDN